MGIPIDRVLLVTHVDTFLSARMPISTVLTLKSEPCLACKQNRDVCFTYVYTQRGKPKPAAV